MFTNILIEFTGTLATVLIYLFTGGNAIFTGLIYTFFLFLSGNLGGRGQLNPAITFAQTLSSKDPNELVQNSSFILAQIVGSLGGVFVYKMVSSYG